MPFKLWAAKTKPSRRLPKQGCEHWLWTCELGINVSPSTDYASPSHHEAGQSSARNAALLACMPTLAAARPHADAPRDTTPHRNAWPIDADTVAARSTAHAHAELPGQLLRARVGATGSASVPGRQAAWQHEGAKVCGLIVSWAVTPRGATVDAHPWRRCRVYLAALSSGTRHEAARLARAQTCTAFSRGGSVRVHMEGARPRRRSTHALDRPWQVHTSRACERLRHLTHRSL